MWGKKTRQIEDLKDALAAAERAAERRVEEACGEVRDIAHRQGRDAYDRAVAAEKRVRFLEEHATDRGPVVCLVKHWRAAS